MNRDCFRFSRRVRLTSPADYQGVFKKPVKSADKFLIILARPNSLGHARLGLAIAKKKIKTAVARNRIKRLARENFRLHQKQLGNLDIIVLAQKHAESADRVMLNSSLNKHWKKLIGRCRS